MDKLHTTMVEVCDRLLLLLTGPKAVTDPEAVAAALEAIELLRVLEGYLKGAADGAVLEDALPESLLRRAEVLNHVNEVLVALRERGLCR